MLQCSVVTNQRQKESIKQEVNVSVGSLFLSLSPAQLHSVYGKSVVIDLFTLSHSHFSTVPVDLQYNVAWSSVLSTFLFPFRSESLLREVLCTHLSLKRYSFSMVSQRIILLILNMMEKAWWSF